jgi:hypothetical protein
LQLFNILLYPHHAQITILGKLKHLFALGNREAEDITLDVTIKVYRKRLAQAAVAGGELDQASSKAAYLQNLCDDIHFDPEKAKEIHEGQCLFYCWDVFEYIYFVIVMLMGSMWVGIYRYL